MYHLGKPKWDQSTLSGRLKHFIAQVSPKLLLYSGSQLDECKSVLQEHYNGLKIHPVNELWRAQYAVYARIHPDTGHKIPAVFTMPGMILASVPVCALMVMPGNSALLGSFYQVVNQSINAGFNYCNRNASMQTTTTQMVGGYFAAVGAAVSVASILRNAITNSSRISSSVKLTLGTFLPFPAVATANTLNLILMRNGEFFNGIEVFNDDGTSAGVSHIAARHAIAYTALSRLILPIPVFIFPPVGILFIEKTSNLLKRFPKTRLPATVALSSLGLYVGAPFAVAAFPQRLSLPTDKLESGCKPSGDLVFFNKGL